MVEYVLASSPGGHDLENRMKEKKQRAIERKKAAEKLEAEAAEAQQPKHKSKSRRSDEASELAGEDQPRRQESSGSYKPADAKLKSLSEITKKRLKQSEGGNDTSKKRNSNSHSNNSNDAEDEGSDVLKSKVTSMKTIIGGSEKRRVIKTSK